MFSSCIYISFSDSLFIIDFRDYSQVTFYIPHADWWWAGDGKCLHEMANAYTDTCYTTKNGQKFHFSGPQMSDLKMNNIHPRLD